MVVGGRIAIASSATQCSKVSFEATTGPVKEASEEVAAWQDIVTMGFLVLRASSWKMKLVICKYWDGYSGLLEMLLDRHLTGFGPKEARSSASWRI
jgi:hypothetical protein